jgi:hypothetical protein
MDKPPTTTRNLDGYGHPELPWSRPHDLLKVSSAGPDTPWFLGTVREDGRPHAASIGAGWVDGDIYFTSSPHAQKARNLDANPACTMSMHLEGIDLVFEGRAQRVTDRPTLDKLVQVYNDGGWPATVDAEAQAITAPFSAPSAGPPPWYLYRMTYDHVVGVATEEPHGATLWLFEN